MSLILASESLYRKSLIEKLGTPFTCIRPKINEEILKKQILLTTDSPVILAETLSYEKGFSVHKSLTENEIVISGDQLVSFENQILGKPGSDLAAEKQLLLLNNKTHQLITAITLFIKNRVLKYNHITHLKMKNLSLEEIQHYVRLESPLDCAGSYKIEQRGIILFETIDCDDFTAIQGIPMIWLSNRLKEHGYGFFKNQS